MKNQKQLAYAGIGILTLSSLFFIMTTEQNTKDPRPAQTTKKADSETVSGSAASDLDRETARNMAVGQVILMASCLGKTGAIPRDRMGDYIAAAVEKQGISRSQLNSQWDFYWGFAKRAEAKEGTTCLE